MKLNLNNNIQKMHSKKLSQQDVYYQFKNQFLGPINYSEIIKPTDKQEDDRNKLAKFIQFQQQSKKRKIQKKYSIFSPESKIIILWNLINFICIYIYFFELPITMGFSSSFLLEQQTDYPLMIINILCIIIFLINIVIKLKTSFYKDGILIDDPIKIVRNYFKFAFYIDIITLIAIFPSEIHRIIYHINHNLYPIKYQKNYTVSLFFYFRIIEVINDVNSINKTLQLHRKAKASFNLLMLLVHILLISTIYASIFFSISTLYCPIQNTITTTTDIISSPLCWIQSIDAYGLILNHQNQPWFVQLGFSLYWAATTMITIGYGDITPKNTGQVYFTIFAQFTSCVLYAYSINKIWQVKSQFESKQQKYQKKVNTINRYMRDKNVSPLLKSKINAYLAHFYNFQKIRQKQQQSEVISQLAPMLKQELVMEVYGFIFKNFKIFNSYSQEFLIQISEHVNQIRYSQNQIIYQIEDQQIDYSLHYIFTGQIQIYLQIGRKKKSIKKFQKDKLFQVYQFFTGIITAQKACATCYSSIYMLKSSSWKNIIMNYVDDHQKFLQIRDSAKYEHNLKALGLRCDFCQSLSHISENCSIQTLKKQHFIYIKNYRKQINPRNNYYIRKQNHKRMDLRVKNQSNQLRFFQATIKMNDTQSIRSNASDHQRQDIYDSDISLRQTKQRQMIESPNSRVLIRKLSLQIQEDLKPKLPKAKDLKIDFEQAQQILNNLNQTNLIKPTLNIDKKWSYNYYFQDYNIENIIVRNLLRLTTRQSEFRSKRYEELI